MLQVYSFDRSLTPYETLQITLMDGAQLSIFRVQCGRLPCMQGQGLVATVQLV